MSTTHISEWKNFCQLESSYGFTSFGFNSAIDRGAAFRLGARYSLAADFSSVEINGKTQNTSDGYAQLIRVVMAWGVIESYYELYNIKIGHQTVRNTYLVPSYCSVKLVQLKDKLNNPQYFKFFSALMPHVNATHSSVIADYLANPFGNYDVSYLLSAIRHVFSHGVLTPHFGRVKPVVTSEICKHLVDFFLEKVSVEFGKKVRQHNSYLSI